MLNEILFWGLIGSQGLILYLFHISVKYTKYDSNKAKYAYLIIPMMNFTLVYLVFYALQNPEFTKYDALTASMSLCLAELPPMLMFLRYYILKSTFKSTQDYTTYVNPIVSINCRYHFESSKIHIYSYILRYVNILFWIFVLLYIVTGAKPPLKFEAHQYLLQDIIMYATTLLAYVYGWVIFVFSCLVKCEVCNLEMFAPDKHMSLIFKVAKLAIKKNVLVCYHCHATYALDAEMDLIQARSIADEFWYNQQESNKIT